MSCSSGGRTTRDHGGRRTRDGGPGLGARSSTAYARFSMNTWPPTVLVSRPPSAASRGRDSKAVVDRLLKMTAVCVVLDKGAALLPARLVNSELGFPNAALPRLHDMTPAANGEALLVGPYTSSEATEHDIEPVRVVGWRGAGRKPLLHAKLLVLGEIDVVGYGPDDGPGLEGLRFLPQTVWWGSANWTDRSRSHLEVGFMCNDPSLASEAAATSSSPARVACRTTRMSRAPAG